MTTYVRSYGEGPQRAVLLHCMLAHSGAWEGLAHELGDTLRMEAMDLPGHGRSADWDPRQDYQTQACDMARPLLQEGAHLIGHSFGGTIALRLAVEHPEQVRSLTLFEPVFFAAAARTDPEAFDENTRLFAPFRAAMEADDRPRAAELFTGAWGSGPPWAAMPQALRDYMSARIHLVSASGPSINDDTVGLWDRLPEVTVPVLLLEGARSPRVISAIQTALEARMPNAQRRVVAEAGHMGPITHPVEVAAQVRSFLADQ